MTANEAIAIRVTAMSDQATMRLRDTIAGIVESDGADALLELQEALLSLANDDDIAPLTDLPPSSRRLAAMLSMRAMTGSVGELL